MACSRTHAEGGAAPAPVPDDAAPRDAASAHAEVSADAHGGEPSSFRACMQPHTGRFARCRKETSASEEDLERCQAKHAHDPRDADRFRINAGAWHAFSANRWTCVTLSAAGPTRVEIEGLGSVDVRPVGDCASQRIDVSEATYGGAIALQCSRRDGGADDSF